VPKSFVVNDIITTFPLLLKLLRCETGNSAHMLSLLMLEILLSHAPLIGVSICAKLVEAVLFNGIVELQSLPIINVMREDTVACCLPRADCIWKLFESLSFTL
jgi:hypothetical protein